MINTTCKHTNTVVVHSRVDEKKDKSIAINQLCSDLFLQVSMSVIATPVIELGPGVGERLDVQHYRCPGRPLASIVINLYYLLV